MYNIYSFAFKLRYISNTEFNTLEKRVNKIQKMISGFKDKLDLMSCVLFLIS